MPPHEQSQRGTSSTLVEPGYLGCSCDIIWHKNVVWNVNIVFQRLWAVQCATSIIMDLFGPSIFPDPGTSGRACMCLCHLWARFGGCHAA